MKRFTKLKKGDPVMVIAGGNKTKRPNKGQVGKLMKFDGLDRAIVEGLNLVTVHQRQTTMDQPARRYQREGPIHLSNLMYYAEAIKKPVRLKSSKLEDGTKVRGYIDPNSGQFVQVER